MDFMLNMNHQRKSLTILIVETASFLQRTTVCFFKFQLNLFELAKSSSDAFFVFLVTSHIYSLLLILTYNRFYIHCFGAISTINEFNAVNKLTDVYGVFNYLIIFFIFFIF